MVWNFQFVQLGVPDEEKYQFKPRDKAIFGCYKRSGIKSRIWRLSSYYGSWHCLLCKDPRTNSDQDQVYSIFIKLGIDWSPAWVNWSPAWDFPTNFENFHPDKFTSAHGAISHNTDGPVQPLNQLWFWNLWQDLQKMPNLAVGGSTS